MSTTLDPYQALAQMRQIKARFAAESAAREAEPCSMNYNYDQESAHCDADEVLVKLLRWLGQDALVETYESIDKWYA